MRSSTKIEITKEYLEDMLKTLDVKQLSQQSGWGKTYLFRKIKEFGVDYQHPRSHKLRLQKIKLTKEFINEEFILKNRTGSDIARETGWSVRYVNKFIEKCCIIKILDFQID